MSTHKIRNIIAGKLIEKKNHTHKTMTNNK